MLGCAAPASPTSRRAAPPLAAGRAGADSGDAERRTRAERVANGVPIDDETWREITVAARSVNVLIEPPRPKSG
jgi:LDH2 family malate/lactate/ureidoglycolate dehydrogenase